MKKTLIIAIAALFIGSIGNTALAYCRDPGSAPEPPRSYDKPRKPSCLQNVRYGEEPECDHYELDRYRDEVDAYIEKLQDFADDSQRYAQEASKYAQCEAAEAREALN